MKLRLIGILAVVVLGASSALVLAAEAANVAELTKELKGEKPAADRGPEQLPAVYVQVIGSLVENLGGDDAGRRSEAQRTLERIAFHAGRPGAEADRAACAAALAGKLGEDVPADARMWILRQLERLGKAEAVAAVAKCLGSKDELVRESARRALQKMDGAEANAALQKALGSATAPEWRAAVINALAGRGDPANVAVLTKEAGSDNDTIRTNAVVGLAKTGDKSAAGAIAAAMAKGTPAAKVTATDSYLLLARTLADKGDKATALGMYKKLMDSAGYVKCAALIGLGLSGGPAELPAIFEALADKDIRTHGAVIQALCAMPGKEVTDAVIAKAKAADAAAKPTLLRALAERGDKAAVPVLLAAAEDADEAVAAEAIRGLGMIGDVSAVPVLLKLASAGKGKGAEAARLALVQTKADGVDKALQAAMGGEDKAVRGEVIRALAGRLVTAATPELLKAAEDADPAVKGEALKALGALAATDSLPAVVALLVKAPDDAARNEAANALIRITGRDNDADKRAEPILKALESATGPAKLALLGVLGRIGGKASLEAVRAATKDADDKTKEAAIRALADWPDASAAEDLLAIAKAAPSETLAVLAIRGYFRILRNDRLSGARGAKMFADGLAAAKRTEEKRQALAGLAECRDILALQTVVPLMDDEALKQEAAQAAVRLGRDIWERNLEPVKAAMQKALDISKNEGVKKDAKETLDKIELKAKGAAK